MDVRALDVLAVYGGGADPLCAPAAFASRDKICIGCESPRNPVHEVCLVELGEEGGGEVRLQCVVCDLAGIDACQKVPLVIRVDDESPSLSTSTQRSSLVAG